MDGRQGGGKLPPTFLDSRPFGALGYKCQAGLIAVGSWYGAGDGAGRESWWYDDGQRHHALSGLVFRAGRRLERVAHQKEHECAGGGLNGGTDISRFRQANVWLYLFGTLAAVAPLPWSAFAASGFKQNARRSWAGGLSQGLWLAVALERAMVRVGGVQRAKVVLCNAVLGQSIAFLFRLFLSAF